MNKINNRETAKKKTVLLKNALMFGGLAIHV